MSAKVSECSLLHCSLVIVTNTAHALVAPMHGGADTCSVVLAHSVGVVQRLYTVFSPLTSKCSLGASTLLLRAFARILHFSYMLHDRAEYH